jgi:hypothetical protein
MNDVKFWEWDLSVRATNVLTDNGCQWESLASAKAFAAEAVESGKADQWRNCGRKTVAELREWSGINERARIKMADELLRAHGYTVLPPNTAPCANTASATATRREEGT